MPDVGQALLADVVAHPDDDGLRLIYADWLDEHGGQPERAQAIRLGVQRAKLDDLDPTAWVLDSRLHRIHAQHTDSWRAKFSSGPLFTAAYAHSVAKLREHEETIFSSGPITALEVLFGDPDDKVLFTGCPYLNRLRKLIIPGTTPVEVLGIPFLAECHGLASLRELNLNTGAHEDDLLESLATCRPFPQLESLVLYRNLFEVDGIRALATAPILTTLQSLDLSQSCFGDQGFRELMRSPHLGRLRKLNLADSGFSTRVVRNLVAIDWQTLESLDLSDNNLGPAATRHLGQAQSMSRLRWLKLGGNQRSFGDDAVKGLARSPYLGQLRALELEFNNLSLKGLRTLARAPWLGNLTRLNLGGQDFGTAEIEVLASAPLHNLRWLDLYYAKIDDDAVKALLACPWLAGLTHLDLNNNVIKSAGGLALADADNLGQLESLDLCTNNLGSEASERLRRRFGDRVELKRSWEK